MTNVTGNGLCKLYSYTSRRA